MSRERSYVKNRPLRHPQGRAAGYAYTFGTIFGQELDKEVGNNLFDHPLAEENVIEDAIKLGSMTKEEPSILLDMGKALIVDSDPGSGWEPGILLKSSWALTTALPKATFNTGKRVVKGVVNGAVIVAKTAVQDAKWVAEGAEAAFDMAKNAPGAVIGALSSSPFASHSGATMEQFMFESEKLIEAQKEKMRREADQEAARETQGEASGNFKAEQLISRMQSNADLRVSSGLGLSGGRSRSREALR